MSMTTPGDDGKGIQDNTTTEATRHAAEEGQAPVRPGFSLVRVVETRGVTAAQFWRLCRERGCVIVRNIIPKNDEGRGLLQARLLCMDYALAFDDASEKNCLLCIPPEGRKATKDFFALGKLFDDNHPNNKYGGGGFCFVYSEPHKTGGNSVPVCEYWRNSANDDDLLWMGGGWCTLFNNYAYRELKYGFTGAKEGEFIYGGAEGVSLSSFETGLYRLEDYSPEEREAIRKAATIRPRLKPAWLYPAGTFDEK